MAQQIPQRGRNRRYNLTPDKKRDFLHGLERLGSGDTTREIVTVHRQQFDEVRRGDRWSRKGWTDAESRGIHIRANALAGGAS